MKHHRKYKPYVRLANGRERSKSLREAFRLAFYESVGKPFYVMVQHGFPNNVIGVGASKREVQRQPVVVAFGRKSFRQWASSIQRHAAKSA
jgi:hypothetical protein